MGRLTQEQWEQARAEYEVRGISLGEIAKAFGVATSSVSRKATAEGWTQGKMQGLVQKKVACIKDLQEVETQKQDLPLHFQHTLESAVQEELQAQGIMATAKIVLASRVIDLANKAETPEALETLTRAHKNLAPQVAKDASTTVNVNQQAAAGVQIQSPKDVLAEIVESAREDNAGQ